MTRILVDVGRPGTSASATDDFLGALRDAQLTSHPDDEMIVLDRYAAWAHMGMKTLAFPSRDGRTLLPAAERELLSALSRSHDIDVLVSLCFTFSVITPTVLVVDDQEASLPPGTLADRRDRENLERQLALVAAERIVTGDDVRARADAVVTAVHELTSTPDTSGQRERRLRLLSDYNRDVITVQV